MKKRTLNPDDVQSFVNYLHRNTSKSSNTIDSYRHALLTIYKTMGSIDKQSVEKFRDTMLGRFSAKTINLYIIAYNCYCVDFLRKPGMKVRNIKIARALFIDNVPTIQEVTTILEGLKNDGKMKDYYLILLLSQTGARVSEIRNFKIEDLQNGYAQILGKGRKMRTIFIPKKTAAEAFLFFKEMYHSDTGYIFKGKTAENISTRGIAEQIQRIGKRYGIRKEVCHPHAFRHYFAKRFLKSSRNNIVMLADLLGHASVDTTAIYLRMSQAETQKKFNNLVDW